MTVDMTTESSTPVQALDTANSATPEWPLTFSVHMIKIQGKSWQFYACMHEYVCVKVNIVPAEKLLDNNLSL